MDQEEPPGVPFFGHLFSHDTLVVQLQWFTSQLYHLGVEGAIA